jgi:hypothetical protein
MRKETTKNGDLYIQWRSSACQLLPPPASRRAVLLDVAPQKNALLIMALKAYTTDNFRYHHLPSEDAASLFNRRSEGSDKK